MAHVRGAARWAELGLTFAVTDQFGVRPKLGLSQTPISHWGCKGDEWGIAALATDLPYCGKRSAFTPVRR